MFGNIRTLIREHIRDELRSLHANLPVVGEDIDSDRMQLEVSRKDDSDVLVDRVPLASAYAGDGYGELHPVGDDDEYLMHVSDVPLEDMTDRGHLEVSRQRSHAMQDGIAHLRWWFPSDEVPDRDSPEDYVYAHQSGTSYRILEDGTFQIEHVDGHTVDVTDSGTIVTIPDENTDREDRETTIRIGTNGQVDVDGDVILGDAEALRIDPDTGDELVAEDERVRPMVDPLTERETGLNPDGARVRAPVNYGFHERRNAVLERREVDPDPAVENPDDPAYINLDWLLTRDEILDELPSEPEDDETLEELMREEEPLVTGADRKIPIGYEWLNLEDEAKKMWGFNEQPVEVSMG